MKVLRKYFQLILLPVASLLASCTSDDFMIGNKYLDNDIRTVLIDTCTVRMTTVPIDPEDIETSGNGFLIFGAYSNNILGLTKCTSYLVFAPPPVKEMTSFPWALPLKDVKFDSVEVVMKRNGNYLGDTTKAHTFKIFRLSEVKELEDEYYSTDSIHYDRTSNTAFRIKPKPASDDYISVRLPDDIGKAILQEVVVDSSTVDEQFEIQELFNGLAITSDNIEKSILAISDTTVKLRIHYHYSTVTERITESFDMALEKSRCFYNIETDRTSTRFAGLDDSEMLSSESENSVIARAMVPSYVKIEFPYLIKLLELGDFGAIVNASLFIYPVRGTYSSEVPLPSEMSLFIRDEYNVRVSAITTYSGKELQTGNLVIDDLFNVDTYYSYDITSFMKDQLDAFGINRRNLELIIPEENLTSTFYTLVAGDMNNQTNRAKIKISYLIYNGK